MFVSTSSGLYWRNLTSKPCTRCTSRSWELGSSKCRFMVGFALFIAPYKRTWSLGILHWHFVLRDQRASRRSYTDRLIALRLWIVGVSEGRVRMYNTFSFLSFSTGRKNARTLLSHIFAAVYSCSVTQMPSKVVRGRGSRAVSILHLATS